MKDFNKLAQRHKSPYFVFLLIFITLLGSNSISAKDGIPIKKNSNEIILKKASNPKPFARLVYAYFDPTTCDYTLTATAVGFDALTSVAISYPGAAMTITKPGLPAVVVGAAGYTITKANIGVEYDLMVMPVGSTDMLNFRLIVLDNSAPVSDAAPAVTIRCSELVGGKAPAPGASYTGTSSAATRMPEPKSNTSGSVLTPVSWISAGSSAIAWNVADCSNFTASYEDILGAVTDCPAAPSYVYRNITRVWTFKDINGMSITVNQLITVVKRPILIPTPLTITDCTASTASVGLPYIDWNGDGVSQSVEIVTPSNNYCGNSVVLMSTNTMPGCAGSSMVMREWKLTDCSTGFTPVAVSQVINVEDKNIPLAAFQFRDFSRMAVTQCRAMGTMQMQEFVYTTTAATIQASAGGGLDLGEMFHGVIKVTPLVNLLGCNEASIDMQMTVSDAKCGGYPLQITSNDARISFDDMAAMQVSSSRTIRIKGTFAATPADPDPSVIIRIRDACGNETRVKILIAIIDNLTPNLTCNQNIDFVLTNNSGTIVSADLLSRGVTDNCTPSAQIRKLIRRVGASCWSTDLTVNCADVGTVPVEIRVIDENGNFVDCNATIRVVDNIAPTCIMQPDVTTYCTDPRLALSTIDNLFTQPDAFNNCGTLTVTSVLSPRGTPADPILINCNSNTITKTWTFKDNANRTAVCSQRLIITPQLGFRVTQLRSETYSCTPNTDDDKERIKSSIKNLNAAGGVTCSRPLMRVIDERYSASSCSRLVRTYILIDDCNPLAVVPSSADLAALVPVPASAPIVDLQDVNGVVVWKRFVDVTDITPPTSPVVANITIPVTDNTCVANFPSITLTASDACGTTPVVNPNLYYDWKVRNSPSTLNNSNVIASGNGSGTGSNNSFTLSSASSTSLQNMPFGDYYLTYSVIDDCSNVGYGTTVKITIKDDKSPTINTLSNKNTVLAYVVGSPGQGMSMVNVSEMLPVVSDNCTSQADLLASLRMVRTATNPTNVYPTGAGQTLMFTCADLTGTNPVPVQIWVMDNAGLPIRKDATITVQDNLSPRACGPTPQSIVSGALKTENNQPIAKVTLSAIRNGIVEVSSNTDESGNYALNILQGNNYVLKPQKTSLEDRYNGITSYDIALISRHILGIEKLSSPYQYIAADVDKSGEVDAGDMLQIRNFILRKSQNLVGGSWRFIDKSYVFKNPDAPFSEDFPEIISLNNPKPTESINFVSVKLADVNRSFTANLTNIAVARSANALVFDVEDRDIQAGKDYTIDVKAENLDATAFQGTFSIMGATITNVKGGNLPNYGDANFGVFGHELTTSWNGRANGKSEVFSVSFTANKTCKLSEMMTVNSAITPALANDAQGIEKSIQLRFNSGKISGNEFALYNAVPNPMSDETTIGFTLPKASLTTLTIYNLEGKTIFTKKMDANAGLNQVVLHKSDLNTSGILYYRLETADYSATKKMVVIE